ncbi:MAG: MotA/TolQ/ExbB proton channel family protein [Candidatus Omnitrophota bacterium]
MLDIIIKGGPVMAPIILGSVVGFAIVVEKFLELRNLKMDSFGFIQEVFHCLKANRIQMALDLCDENAKYPIAAVFKVGIERRYLAPQRLEKVMEQVGNNQVLKIEKYLGAMASIISIEPLLGFLGTITGLIKAFMAWEHAGANITVNALAAGIYQAMITTAAGLIIAIPLFLCYNYFVSRIKYMSNELTNHSIQFLELIIELKEAGNL